MPCPWIISRLEYKFTELSTLYILQSVLLKVKYVVCVDLAGERGQFCNADGSASISTHISLIEGKKLQLIFLCLDFKRNQSRGQPDPPTLSLIISDN